MKTATVTQLHRYVIERIDRDNGDISYEVINVSPGQYSILCRFDEEDYEDRRQALRDANLVMRALNAWTARGGQ